MLEKSNPNNDTTSILIIRLQREPDCEKAKRRRQASPPLCWGTGGRGDATPACYWRRHTGCANARRRWQYHTGCTDAPRCNRCLCRWRRRCRQAWP